MAVWTPVVSFVVMSVVVIATVMGLSEEIRGSSRLRRRRPLYEQFGGGRHTQPMRPSLNLENILSSDSDFSFQNYKTKVDKRKHRERHFYPSKLLNLNELDIRSRRSFDVAKSVSVCAKDAKWLRLQTAIDINENNVTLVQDGVGSQTDQVFFVVTCRNENCCDGIDTARFYSKCKQEYSYVPATIRSPTDQSLTEVRTIQYASHCDCHVSPRS